MFKPRTTHSGSGKKLIRHRLAIAAGGSFLLGGLGVAVIDIAYPDFWSAIWTRAQYSEETRLIDSSQYVHTVSISSGHTQASGSRNGTGSAAAVEPNGKTALLQMAGQTSSNFVLMDSDGNTLVEGYFATPEANNAMLTNSMSMAKSLVGLLVGVAIEEGAIQSVDQPIGELIEEFKDDERGRITVKNLLQMESGLASQNSGFPLTYLQAMYFGDSPDARAISVPAVAPPGKGFSYNSVNSQILLIILERHLGGEFEELLTRYIWEPLNLDPGFAWRASPTGDAKGFCCVFATARAWAEIGRVFLTQSIVSKAWVEQTMTPSREGSRYGYQIRLGTLDDKGIAFANFDGTPQQFVYILPALGLVAVRVGDEDPAFSDEEFLSAVVEFHADMAENASPN